MVLEIAIIVSQPAKQEITPTFAFRSPLVAHSNEHL